MIEIHIYVDYGDFEKDLEAVKPILEHLKANGIIKDDAGTPLGTLVNGVLLAEGLKLLPRLKLEVKETEESDAWKQL